MSAAEKTNRSSSFGLDFFTCLGSTGQSPAERSSFRPLKASLALVFELEVTSDALWPIGGVALLLGPGRGGIPGATDFILAVIKPV